MMKLIIFAGLMAVALCDVSHLSSRTARILRLVNEVYPDGRYEYAYDTENGISAQEQGQQRYSGPDAGTVAQGNFQYTSPEGVPVRVQYVADENGYQPSSDLLPTSPPIPPAIARSLQYIASHQTQSNRY